MPVPAAKAQVVTVQFMPETVGAVRKTLVVKTDAGETTQPVAITEGGPIPPRIALAPAAATAAPATPAPATTTTPATATTRPGGKTGTAAVAGKPAPSAMGTTMNAQRNFE